MKKLKKVETLKMTKVGLSQRIFYHNGQSYDATDHNWYSFLNDKEITPIPNTINQDFKKLADELDIVILTGGNDPSIRRLTETKIATAMLKKNKPVLGICHGAFLLTELLGGTVTPCENHYNTEHDILTESGIIIVNSYHTLKIAIPPITSTVLARDATGNCESWVDGSVSAITWHPERMKTPYIPDEIIDRFFN